MSVLKSVRAIECEWGPLFLDRRSIGADRLGFTYPIKLRQPAILLPPSMTNDPVMLFIISR